MPVLDAGAAEARFAAIVDDLACAGQSMELVAMLDEQHPAYAEQPSAAIARMRSWILIALSRSELPDAALPFVLEELDTSLEARLVASAALALRAYPRPGPALAPFLLTALNNIRPHDEPVSVARYGDYEPSADATSAVGELLRSIAWLGPAAVSLAPALRAWQVQRSISSRLRPDLEGALAAIGTVNSNGLPKEECCLSSLLRGFDTAPAAGDASGAIADILFEDQDGVALTFRELFHGRPSIVAFFYTRCDNPLKCSLTVWKLARLQELLEQRGMAGRFRIAAITYDPGFDLPERMRPYGRNRGFRMDADHRLLRSTESMAAVRTFFGLRASFAQSLVSRHRIELFLLDARGRIARSFPRLRWNEPEVADAALALAETAGASPHETVAPRPAAAGGVLGAALIAAVPKCPLCWNAYLSSVGLGVLSASASPGRMQALAGALLVLHLASVWWRARSTHQMCGAVLSTAGALSLGATLALGVWPAAVGVVLVVLGAVVSTRAQRDRTPAHQESSDRTSAPAAREPRRETDRQAPSQ